MSLGRREARYFQDAAIRLYDRENNYYVLNFWLRADPEDRCERFESDESVARFLRRCLASDSPGYWLGNEWALRQHFFYNGYIFEYHISLEKLIAIAARFIKTREVVAIPKYWEARAVLDAVKEKEKETEAAVKKAGFGLSPPIFGTAWIRFKIVDDRTDEVIPGVKLTVDHQDGIYKELVSDAHGTISFENIKRGMCDITGDAMKGWRATIFNTLGFVGIGDKPPGLEEDKKPVARPAHKRPSPAGRNDYQHVAKIIEHRVKSGETLKSIAMDHGISFRDLAYFNWGSYNRGEIVRCMERDMGCATRTENGRDCLFSDSDEPGILFIPQPLCEEDFPTGATHTVRVKRYAHELRYLYQIDLDDPESHDDVISLVNDDETWKYSIHVDELEELEPDWVELVFPVPPPGSLYSMIHDFSDGTEPLCLFQNYTHDQLFYHEPEHETYINMEEVK